MRARNQNEIECRQSTSQLGSFFLRTTEKSETDGNEERATIARKANLRALDIEYCVSLPVLVEL